MTTPVTSQEIDSVLSEMIATSSSGLITLQALQSHFSIPETEEEKEQFQERLERALDGNEELFVAPDHVNWFVRNKFFNGKRIVLTPDEYEIDNNILIPGHRFAAFAADEIFPSEVTLVRETEDNCFKTKEFEADLMEVIGLHIYLGSGQLYDFFIAENQQNKELLSGANSQKKLQLHVFDMTDFYRQHQFCSGDALVVTILDYEKGLFSCRYLNSVDRRRQNETKWIEKFGAALEAVMDEWKDYLEIIEQLRYAFFIGGDSLFGDQGASLDEFLQENDVVEIQVDDVGHSFFIKRNEADSDEECSVPEAVSISRGDTADLSTMLREAGTTLTIPELDAFLLDQCFNRDLAFENFYHRCFGEQPLSFADDAQEVAFQNLLEERWENLSETYNRYEDEDKAKLRTLILDIVEERIAFFAALRSLELDTDQLPEEPMRKLVESSLYLSNLLELLNSPANSLQETEQEELADLIDEMGLCQEEAIQELNDFTEQGKRNS